jgi:glucose/arabinose dehydrogenase
MLSQRSEQGLLGLAFHPNYQDNGFFYVDYTDLQGNTQIVRYQVSDDPDQANASSAVVLFSFSQPYANHNGGQLAFGPDGFLYIGLGDGGSANDPQNNAQNLSTPLGTILRIDVKDDGSYTVPPTNPFIGQENADERIWAWGLRNPWRFSFDRQTGDLYIADVGQNQWEEIDFQSADSAGGLNYGWRCMEATHQNISQTPCSDPGYADQFIGPVAEYSHQMGQSITGGYVYRGNDFPFLNGIYFYGDFSSGRIWSIQLQDRQSQTWSEAQLELETGINISSFGEDENGEIFLADYYGGTIRQLAAEPR